MHLSDYMLLKNLRDEDFAPLIGRSRVTVSRIRRRKVRPDWDTIDRIKAVTGGCVTANDFVQREPAIVTRTRNVPRAQPATD